MKRHLNRLVLCLFALLPATASGQAARSDTTAWVQAVAGGFEARAMTQAVTCPVLHANGVAVSMTVRAAADDRFPLLCAARLPAGTSLADIDGAALPVPAADPSRILLVGDSGCRRKGATVQDCRHQWPFAQTAAAAAALHPDLVIHLGDYVSRESPCAPHAKDCVESPHGDTGPAWRVDFFDPAAPLLAAAPVVLARGNHEDCSRQGRGWLRLMGPGPFDPAGSCASHVPLFTVDLGTLHLAVMDDASTPDRALNRGDLPAYIADLNGLRALASPVWLVLHRPIWAAIAGPLGIPVGGNRTMVQAVHDAAQAQAEAGQDVPLMPASVALQLSGHIHAFEAINYDRSVPPQIVAGIGGDMLHDTPENLWGAVFQGPETVRVTTGISDHGFGFVLMTRTVDGWSVELYDSAGNPTRNCHFYAARANQPGQVDCPTAK